MQYLNSEAAFGLHLSQFSDRIYEEMADALIAYNIKIQAKSTSIIQLLYSEGPCSQADLATHLKTSHQLIAQRVSTLSKMSMVDLTQDAEDRRRKLINLTPAGRKEGQKLQIFLPQLIKAYLDLYEELGLDLDDIIQRSDSALENKSLLDRFPAKAAS